MALLDIHIHAKRYGTRTVLRQLALHVNAGELVCLVGASGCGKSTLLRLIAGLDTDYDGHISLSGRTLHGLSSDIGFVFQEPRLMPWLDVSDNIAFGAPNSPGQQERIARLLNEVGLAGHAHALPKQLSGGQAQRVAIARALFRQPRVLLLDEPFSAVDAFTRMRLQDLLTELVQEHAITVLMVTHDLDEAALLSDRVLVLDHVPGPLLASLPVPLGHPRQRDDDAVLQARTDLLHCLQAAHAL
ncbi:ABC transporter ATP-binding protein [Aquabacterium sp.]|uniref:ABC transporter ATP-binding protein n=1 Tax=Aquabacterium sp. TaxID=1872578 RepID=UPI0035C7330F